jgi:hypothetical protein
MRRNLRRSVAPFLLHAAGQQEENGLGASRGRPEILSPQVPLLWTAYARAYTDDVDLHRVDSEESRGSTFKNGRCKPRAPLPRVGVTDGDV